MSIIDRRGIVVGAATPSPGSTDPYADLAIKVACRVATTANISLVGEPTIDGVAVIAGDRVLVKDQTDATQNGVYVVSSGNWIRSDDFEAMSDLASGLLVAIVDGSASAQKIYQLTTADPIVLDTSSLAFDLTGGKVITLTAGAGLTGGGDTSADRTFSVGAGVGITVNADSVALANTAVTPGSYTNASITVDQQGRITSASDGGGGGGGLDNIVEDTTPQIGGALDANGFNIGFDDNTGITDDSGNEQLTFQKTASAVNQFEMTNAATGTGPLLSVAGGDTNIDFNLSGKGAGSVKVAGPRLFLGGVQVMNNVSANSIPDFDGSLFIGSGGASVTHTTGLEGRYITAVGFRCLSKNTTGSYNTGLGFEVMEDVTTGSYNTAIGEAAGIYNKTGNGNSLLGWKAGLGTSGIGLGDYNTLGGYGSGITASAAVTNNVGYGAWTLNGTTFTGNANTAVGTQAGFGITSGSNNSLFGFQSGDEITTGTNNLILGTSNAGSGLGTGSNNVFVGNVALGGNVSNYIILADGTGQQRILANASSTLFYVGATPNVVTLPVATDTLVGKATIDTLINKTFDTAGTGNSFSINGVAAMANTGTGSVVRATSPTLVTPTIGVATATSVNKLAITAPASSATLTIPDGVTLTGPAASGTAMTLGNTETVTGFKTFGSSGAVGRFKLAGTTSGTTTLDASATASGTLTLPAATDTLVGKATMDTLTNKTFDTAGTGNSFSINGVAATANTGTGAVVRAASPTFTGTPAAPTAAISDNSTALATTAYVKSQQVWVHWAGGGTTINAQNGVSSISRSGAGQYTINFTNAFANASYAAAFCAIANTGDVWGFAIAVQAAGSAQIYIRNGSGILTDPTNISAIFEGAR